ncbi:MAG: isoprenylcysteine carboxylmethyltransferase family protein [Spirochaetaceae bacterium]|nr:isoprenylcysteine carboxylmethyltransferase family protein [Spirochaetaceae bacterium]
MVIFYILFLGRTLLLYKRGIKVWVIGTSTRKIMGIVLCYIGLIIFFLALISFGKSWRIGIDENNSNDLITDGMFKYSRNPVFLFMDIYFIGIMLIYPNIVFTLLAIGTIIGIHLQIIREEDFLLKKFGDKYIEYKNKTRRYI